MARLDQFSADALFSLYRDHPLLGLSNVLITPHIGTSTYTTTEKVVQRMIHNVLAALADQTAPDELKAK